MLKPDIHIRNIHNDSTRLEESLTLRALIPVLNTGVFADLIKKTLAQRERKLSHSTINKLT
jgi:hypothetical protein